MINHECDKCKDEIRGDICYCDSCLDEKLEEAFTEGYNDATKELTENK